MSIILLITGHITCPAVWNALQPRMGDSNCQDSLYGFLPQFLADCWIYFYVYDTPTPRPAFGLIFVLTFIDWNTLFSRDIFSFQISDHLEHQCFDEVSSFLIHTGTFKI